MLRKRMSAFLIAISVILMQMIFVYAAETPTVLDITAGAITIGPAGASGGGLAEAETELNSAGYIIEGGNTEVANKITVLENTNVTITLRSVEIRGNNILINEGAVVNLLLENNNSITATASGSAAITVNTTAKLLIRGNGALTVKGGARAAGIGAKIGNPCGDITIYSGTVIATGGTSGGAGIGGSATENIMGNIEIFGGNVNASGTGGGAAIGAGKGRQRKGNISIHGGNVTAASTGWGIGDGTQSTAVSNPVVIDAGSVAGTVQGRPKNLAGDDVYRVEAVLEQAEGQTVTVLDEWGKAWDASTNSTGAVFSYLPMNAKLAAAQYGGKLYTAEVEMKEDDTEKVTLQEYTGAPCSCTEDTADFVLESEEVVVNRNMGFKSLPLSAQFTKAEHCTYPIHGGSVSYALGSGVTASDAVIEDNILTVYTSAEGKTVPVTATVSVGGKAYTAAAEYPVTVSDAAEFDLALGDIVVNQDSVQVGNTTPYPVGADQTVYIWQNTSGSVSNTIKVSAGVTKNIVFRGINIQRMGIADYAVDILGDVTLTLEGNNRIVENATDHPAIRCGIGSKLTIEGEGTLVASGGVNAAGIGGTREGIAGAVVINGGELHVTAGNGGGAAIGCGANGTGAVVTINGGKVFAASSDGPAIGNGKTGNGSEVKITGGMVQAYGAEKGISGTTVSVDAGSVNATGFAREQTTAGGQKVYRTILTVEDAGVNIGMKDVTYTVGNSSASLKTSTDESGKLYLYLPAGETWVKILVNDGTKNYYKRMQISSTGENQGICTSDLEKRIVDFNIPGQLSSTVDEETHTISVQMSAGAYLESLTPMLTIKGSQYLPSGAQDFSNSEAQPVDYTVIGEDGSEQLYWVSVTRSSSDENQPLELNIADGIIQIAADAVSVGSNRMSPPHPGGYVITGTSNENMILIANDEEDVRIDFPIIFRDLKINAPQITGGTALSPVSISGDAVITIQGENTLIAGDEVSAISVPDTSALTLQGDGILNVYGGTSSVAIGGSYSDGDACGAVTINGGTITAVGGNNAPAIGGMGAADAQGKFVINAGSVHLIDGEGTLEGSALVPKSASGARLYPMELVLTDGSITNTRVGYIDSTHQEAVSLVTDAQGKLYIYHTTGKDDIAVLYNNVKYYASTNVQDAGIGPIRVDLPRVTGIQFTDPKQYQAVRIAFTLQGTNLGGELVVTATPTTGEPVSAAAVKNNRGDYIATLSFPENANSDSELVYSITVTADGAAQSLSGDNLTVVKPAKLRIFDFSIEGQIGESLIDETNDTITFVLPYDVTGMSYIPTVRHNGSGNTSGLLDFGSQADGINFSIWNDAETREYRVKAIVQSTPKVTRLQFDNPANYSGGNVVITLVGENLDNAANALHHTKEIAVAVSGLTTVNATKNAQGVWSVNVNIPPNNNTAQNKEYPLQVTVGGVQQTLSGNSVLTVPRMPDSSGEISVFEIDGQFGETQFHTTDGLNFTVTVYMPYGTDLTELLPYVEVTSERADYNPKTPQDFTEPVTYTLITEIGQEKIYNVRVIAFADMTCEEIQITNPQTWEGGLAAVNLKASFTTSVTAQAIAADGTVIEAVVKDLKPSLNAEEGSAYLEFELPENLSTHNDASYTLKIQLDGVEQNDLQQYRLIVPHRKISEDSLRITGVTVPRMTGEAEFDGNTITLRARGNITAIEPVIEHTGASVSPTGEQDFSQPVVYTIYDEYGEERQYTIVIKKLSSSKPINWNLLPDIGTTVKPSDEPNTITIENHPYINGYEDGTFNPQNSLTRAETVKILAEISEEYEQGKKYSQAFQDISPQSWYANAVGFASQKEIVQGDSEGTFRPEDFITRMEFAAMIARYANLAPIEGETFTDIAGAWGEGYINALSKAGVLTGYEDGSFRPEQQVTRAEAIVMINRAIGRSPNEDAIDLLAPRFSDVPKTHWAYYQIMAASAQYEYEMPQKSEEE